MSDLSEDLYTAYTYEDYLSWNESEIGRCELIDGEVYMMASPNRNHLLLSRLFFRQFDGFLFGKPCQVFYAPFDVRLFPKEDKSDKTVVQPDLFVVCDQTKFQDLTCLKGPPDLVIEIISPSTKSHDRVLKKEQYRKAGVAEYWIVVNHKKIIVHLLLDDGNYQKVTYTALEGLLKVPVHIFHDQLVIAIRESDLSLT